ncbi:hypothetical protein ABE44_33205 [Bacillus thuringiensis]|uniref:hypothetical protein n=1 Tax=Bacillus thuringiensis TaxID=1428 RepID=UPI0018CE6DDE|nr:hypothetical protein [Bacillus thuringiensis]MBG9503730.1 hypothetical protein [Bacillus thuringiensis]MBG9504252.1 hypothetical protein [Bacillus thuringiensis]
MRSVSVCNQNQKRFVGGTVGKGKMYTLHLDEYVQAMAIARTFVKPAEREGFWVESAIELLAGCMMYFQKKRGELLYVDVEQTLDLLQKATEQEDYVAELMKSIGENHPSYHIFKRIDPSERMTRTGIIEKLVSILRKHDIYQQYPKVLERGKGV